jgi:hypothetical protein
VGRRDQTLRIRSSSWRNWRDAILGEVLKERVTLDRSQGFGPSERGASLRRDGQSSPRGEPALSALADETERVIPRSVLGSGVSFCRRSTERHT